MAQPWLNFRGFFFDASTCHTYHTLFDVGHTFTSVTALAALIESTELLLSITRTIFQCRTYLIREVRRAELVS